MTNETVLTDYYKKGKEPMPSVFKNCFLPQSGCHSHLITTGSNKLKLFPFHFYDCTIMLLLTEEQYFSKKSSGSVILKSKAYNT